MKCHLNGQRSALSALLPVLLGALFLAPGGTAAQGTALNWQTGEGHRWSELPVPRTGKTGFTLLPPEITGISFTNFISDQRAVTNQNLLNGSGVALGDVDGDGLCDVYLCRLDGRENKLYRNLGNWKFQDVTEPAGVGCGNQNSTGATFADIDGDGALDLLVNSMGGGTRVFLNDGKGHFKEVTAQAGVLAGTAAMSMALADVDGDGDLDLYVANNRSSTIREEPNTDISIKVVDGQSVVVKVNGQPASRPEYAGRFSIGPTGKILEYGEVDVLYLNDGKGHFQALSFTNGGFFMDEDGTPLREPPRDWGLAVQFYDLNGDGAPDIYVCNDLFTPDRIWINNGKGKFRAINRLALRHTSTFSMGVDCGDLNRDGIVDFLVVDMFSRDHQKRQVQIGESGVIRSPVGLIDNRPQADRNTLQLGRGDGTFAEVAFYAGVEGSEWSWGPIFLDVDLDGFEDILVPNGQLRDFQNGDFLARLEAAQVGTKLSHSEVLQIWKLFPPLETPKVAFRNRGNLTFEEVGAAWGFSTPGISRGMALADLDGDGDLDVVVNNFNAAAGLYRNESPAPRVAVRLQGLAPNTRGIGAKIWLYGGAVPVQSQEMICGGRYLSGDDPMRVFAAGNLTNEMRIEVRWRSGKRSFVNGVKSNRVYEIDEAGAQVKADIEHRTSNIEQPTSNNQQPTTNNQQPVFEDVSQLINQKHHEEEFNDFERQAMLPRKLSQLGPGVAWQDLDGDGWEELVIGSGRGGRLAVYRNNGRGGFQPWNGAPFDKMVTRDQTTVLGMEFGLVVGSANYEDGLTNGGCVRIYDLKREASGESVLGQVFSAGPLALADVDGDGDLDLFVGGRVIGGRYPEAADSLLLKNEGGRLVVGQRFEKLGLVSGAVWSDLDGDGKPELILACEWGPLRIFRNDRGRLVAWDAPVTNNPQPATDNQQKVTINQLSGWWNGVTTGDLDGDGRMDIIASNWGLNSKYRTSWQHPRKVYYGDLEGSGTVDVIEGYYDEAMKQEMPEQGLRVVALALPFVKEKFGTYEAYGKANLVEIYGDKLKGMGVVEARVLESMVFLNRGDHFEARPLPAEAQLAPAYAVCVGDYDGDGKEDIFLSQNFFPMNPETGRNDAGRGLWLRGDGKGNLTAVAGQQSGVRVYGEQRGAALCDYDGDGRVDLVVTQNGAETKLFHNVGGRPGLRVRLKSAAGNLQAVGAQMRLSFGPRQGPMREVHAGSGYWSQDSAVQVLGAAEPPTQIQVRWPGGKVTTSAIPDKAREISIDSNGKLEVIRMSDSLSP